MQKKKFLAAVMLIIVLSIGSEGKILSFLSPKDKAITHQSILTLRGTGANLMYARVNGIMLDLKGNSFSCGLVLTPGKNFAKIEAWDKEGNFETYTRRILRLVSFPDVDEPYSGRPHCAKGQIITLATLGIIEAYPDNNYYLNKSLTRGELATWICRAKGFKTSLPASNVFVDVPKEHWRSPFIKEISGRKYMGGNSDGYFGIDLSISRAEAALAALKAEGSAFEKEIVSVFYDVPKTYTYYEQIKEAKSKGLIRGIHWKKAIYEPNRDITRAEAAMLFMRFTRIKWLKKWLFDFSRGYTNFCKINTPPKIVDAQVTPKTFSINESPAMNLRVRVEDREGRANLLHVKADISSFGGPPDAEMHDKGEGEYVLQFMASPESWGEKTISVTAIDKLGWRGEEKVKVIVAK